MIHDESFAYLVTWTTYGTWLPGDDRGHVSPARSDDGLLIPRQNVIGEPHGAPDPRAAFMARQQQKDTTVWLNHELATVVANSLIESCASRKWRIHRAAIMVSHVHVVVGNCPPKGSAVLRVLKGVSQAELDPHRRWWTRGGSNPPLLGEEAIRAAIEYVANQVGKLVEIIDGALRNPGG